MVVQVYNSISFYLHPDLIHSDFNRYQLENAPTDFPIKHNLCSSTINVVNGISGVYGAVLDMGIDGLSIHNHWNGAAILRTEMPRRGYLLALSWCDLFQDFHRGG